MPLIKMKVVMAGPEGRMLPGLHDVDEALAKFLVGHQYAEYAETRRGRPLQKLSNRGIPLGDGDGTREDSGPNDVAGDADDGKGAVQRHAQRRR